MEVTHNESTGLKQPVENEKAIVINQIVIRNIDRTMKDISTWRNAHIAAERVIWPIRQRLYDLYSDVKVDGHLHGIIKKRFSAVTNKKLYFRNNKNEKVEELDALIKSKSFCNFRKEVLNTILWGISGMEFIPGKAFAWELIPRKHIKPEYKIITKEQYGFDGFPYEQMANIMVLGEAHDLGELLYCCPYALWKRGGFADYAQFVEIFGQPVRIYEYDAFDIKTKDEVQKVANEAGGAMSLLIPKQAGFRMEDGKTANANGDLQTKFIKCLNDEMSVVILGNTQTTTSSEGSGYAQSKTHGEQQLEITQGDMEYELQYLNSPQFLAICKSYGFPTEGGEFAHEQQANVSALSERIKVDSVLCKIVPIADEYFYDTYHVPKPDNYDALKTEMKEAAKALLKMPVVDNNNPIPGEKKAPMDKPVSDEPDDLKASNSDASTWNKMRMRLADFFDQAPRD